MLYQLGDGRTIEISLHEYLTCSDEELNALKSTNYGLEINNPQYGSAITKPQRIERDEEPEDSNFNISEEDKFDDIDYTDEDYSS